MKFKLILLFCLIFSNGVFASEVLAPAVQFNIDDYKNYFKKTTDYKLYLKSRSDYKITCDTDIIGITWGDKDNIKVYDKKNESGEVIDMKSTILKLKYGTNSYLRLYKNSGEIVNIVINVHPLFQGEQTVSMGLCKLTSYKE